MCHRFRFVMLTSVENQIDPTSRDAIAQRISNTGFPQCRKRLEQQRNDPQNAVYNINDLSESYQPEKIAVVQCEALPL